MNSFPLLQKTTEATTTTTATNLKSNEFSANYLLASGLVSRPPPSSSSSQPSPATLTHPTNPDRQMFGVNYSSINSRRLPYIERLRRRTLQDCIRLNRTMDSEPYVFKQHSLLFRFLRIRSARRLSESVIEEHKSATASPIPKRVKVQEKECGIQCDVSRLPWKTESNRFSCRFQLLEVRLNQLKKLKVHFLRQIFGKKH